MVGIARLDRYWHTVRHLRPVQIYGRVWFWVARPGVRRTPAPSLRRQGGVWQAPARRLPTLIGPGEFQFLGARGTLAELGWDGPERDRLWRYNQHYFDDLNASDGEARTPWHVALLQHWVDRNPPFEGTAWEPYPTSLRIVNWIKWVLAGHELPVACVDSLALQTRWLAGRLETHLLGNHLLANAKALVFSGLFFEGPEADRWLAKGLEILAREIPEQILPDGGHFERTTMYHALALEDVLDLCNLAIALPGSRAPGADQVACWRECVLRMRRWLDIMCHPDGRISFFNDAAFGIAPEMEELHAYADRVLGRPGSLHPATGGRPSPCALHLRDSGYVRVDCANAVALLDVGRVGPDYLPGHAHADTLSFEFSVDRQRVFVNGGTSIYGTSAERLRQRGTAAHNTVVVGGHDSSEVWSGFRVARRALPFGLEIRQSALPSGTPSTLVRCAHDGYMRLPGRPVHERTWRFEPESMTIEDTVSGGVAAEARFHVHPGVAVHPDRNPASGTLLLPGNRRLRWYVSAGVPRIEASTWHPQFGSSEANKCIVVSLTGGHARLRIEWPRDGAQGDPAQGAPCTSSS